MVTISPVGDIHIVSSKRGMDKLNRIVSMAIMEIDIWSETVNLWYFLCR